MQPHSTQREECPSCGVLGGRAPARVWWFVSCHGGFLTARLPHHARSQLPLTSKAGTTRRQAGTTRQAGRQAGTTKQAGRHDQAGTTRQAGTSNAGTPKHSAHHHAQSPHGKPA
ncbi:hypothetical protein PMIN06_012323 [Paraphaeosphaeria minitans]